MDSVELGAVDGQGARPAASLGRGKWPYLMAALVVCATLVILARSLYNDSGLGASLSGAGPVVCREAIWDFGSLSQLAPQSLKHAFRLENTSGEAVTIEKVTTGCSCTVVGEHASQIAGKSVTDLNLSVYAAGPPGPFQKLVLVEIGTSPPSKLVLAIQGVILPSPAFFSTPKKLDFGTIGDNETRTRVVKVARHDASPLKYRATVTGSPWLSVVSAKSSDQDESAMEITIALDGSVANGENLASTITVKTDHQGYPDFEIPVVGTFRHERHGLVQSIHLDQLAVGSPRDAALAADGQGPGTIVSVRYEGEPGLVVELVPGPAAGQGVGAHVPAARISRTEPTGEVKIIRGQLVVELSDHKRPIRIPLSVDLSG